jgi:hypothetical protein
MSLHQNVGGVIKTLAGDGSNIGNIECGEINYDIANSYTKTISTTSMAKYVVLLLGVKGYISSAADTAHTTLKCFTASGETGSVGSLANTSLTVTISNTSVKFSKTGSGSTVGNHNVGGVYIIIY